MFFVPVDLSDSRYQIDSGFIARGLARNEDEYFNATGSELALLWHAPWYVVSAEANIAAARAGYVTVDRDIDPYDWISREDEKNYGLPQYSAADMVDLLMGRITSLAKPGAIIPIRLGFLSGGRSDYLFQRLNGLLGALAEEGYTVVPVSKIVNHFKYSTPRSLTSLLSKKQPNGIKKAFEKSPCTDFFSGNKGHPVQFTFIVIED
jgi:hypothetical protein